MSLKLLKHNKLLVQFFTIHIRKNSSTVALSIPEAKNNVETPKTNKKQKWQTFLTTNNLSHVTDLSYLPKGLFSKRSKIRNLYLINKSTATTFASLILDDLLKNKDGSIIIEANPGLGYLTKELLKGGVPFINLYEPNSSFSKNKLLVDLMEKYHDRLLINSIQFFSLWTLKFNDKFQESILLNRRWREWENKPTMLIVGVVTNVSFITEVIRSIIFKSFLVHYGRPKLYLSMSPSMWFKLTSMQNTRSVYSWRSILFQLLFNFKHIGTVNRKSFVPWPRLKNYRRSTIFESLDSLDGLYMYIVEIEPKTDLFMTFFSENELLLFWYFIRNNMASRSCRIIPELEKWAPSCGLEMISLGHNIFTDFGELSPLEILEVFRKFISHPNFEKEAYLNRLQNSDNEIKEIEVEDQFETTTEMDDKV